MISKRQLKLQRRAKRIKLRLIADQIIQSLKAEGIIIQRLDSITTSSIYLKLDYGVCRSIRIADHKGKAGLHYKFNLATQILENYSTDENGRNRLYYNADSVQELIDAVIKFRFNEMMNYGPDRYKYFMLKNLDDKKHSKGFWEKAKLV